MPRRTEAVWLRARALSSRPKLNPASPIVASMMPVHVGVLLIDSGYGCTLTTQEGRTLSERAVSAAGGRKPPGPAISLQIAWELH